MASDKPGRANSTRHWCLVLACIAASIAFPHAPSHASSVADARLQVTARVLKYLRLQVVSQPLTVEITEADVARGWVEVTQRMQVSVESNAPEGYALALANRSAAVRLVKVSGLGPELQLSTESMAVRTASRRGMARDVLGLGFRFDLTPEARPGSHAWPIQVSVLPL
jgi:hypothetical protein